MTFSTLDVLPQPAAAPSPAAGPTTWTQCSTIWPVCRRGRLNMRTMACSFLTMEVPVRRPQPSTSHPPPSSSSRARTSLILPSATTTTPDRTHSRSLSSLSAPTVRDRPLDSILHARPHSFQQVCQHRITGQQLSKHPPPADTVLVPLT